MDKSSHTDTSEHDRLLRVDEVGERLGITPRSVKRLAAQGRLRRIVLGRRTTRYYESDLRQLIERCTAPHNDEASAVAADASSNPAGQGRRDPV